MTNDEVIQYYDYLMRLATSKCGSQTDAEDLVGDTMLAAFAYMHKGGTIEHPKTWLTNTLFYKHNSNLRKKYRAPVTVCLEDAADVAGQEDDDFLASDEASKLRKELNHLGFITREVLVRFYFGNQSVADIAEGLGIPEGTVKSRLSAGRSQIKKGLETMENKENYIPGKLDITFGGAEGLNGEPMSLVEGDLIVQNLLILAYEKPVTISELSKAIAIPAAYIEPIVKKLVCGELMVQTESGKVYTDFIITKPQNSLKNFKPQLDFSHKHFEKIWSILDEMSKRISEMPFVQNMCSEERTKLDRFAVLKALQDFQHYGSEKIEAPKFPRRKDGGRWIAQGIAFDAGYNMKEYNEASEYAIHGGLRTTKAVSNTPDGQTKQLWLYEFDTTLWDSPYRYAGIYELYFKHIIPLLWHIYNGVQSENSEIPNELIANIPDLVRLGMFKKVEEKLCVAIPVLKKEEYDEVCAVIKEATAKIKSEIGDEFFAFTASMKTPVPKHLTSVPELLRYHEATKYFVMSIVREAYREGLHLKDVDCCCPPVVFVYE